MFSLVALETSRPLLIDDNDCDVSEPTPVDDECIRPQGIAMPPPGQFTPTALIAVVPVVRITAQLKKTLTSQTIAATTLAACDEHFKSIMSSWPDPYPIHSSAPLDPRLLTAACSLQLMRFYLYRNNLSSACRQSDRRDALDRCIAVAQDTAHYVQRALQHPSALTSHGYLSPAHLAEWAARVRTMTPAFFATHLWRCQLVLCLRCDFTSAATLVHASAAIGDLRKNNVACGRYLAFFLGKLIGRLRGGATAQTLESDEEMLAYASGDMQGCADAAWAWAGNETPPSSQSLMANGYAGDRDRDRPGLPPDHQLASNMLSGREAHEWGGWEYIQRTLSDLIHEQQQHQHQHHQHSAPPSSSSQYSPHPGQGYPPGAAPPRSLPPLSAQNYSLPPPSVSPPANHGTVGSSVASNRISIRDIM